MITILCLKLFKSFALDIQWPRLPCAVHKSSPSSPYLSYLLLLPLYTHFSDNFEPFSFLSLGNGFTPLCL